VRHLRGGTAEIGSRKNRAFQKLSYIPMLAT